MKRRAFLARLGGAVAAWPLAARAQQVKTARIGFGSLHSPELAGHVAHVREGLRQLGHVEGKTYEIESHFTGGNRQRAQEIMGRLSKSASISSWRGQRQRFNSPKRRRKPFQL